MTNGKPANALASGREYRVAHRGGNNWETRLTNSGRLFLAHNHVHFGLRRFRDARHFVIAEIGLLDAAALDGNGVVESGREAVNRGALDLGAHAVGVHGPAAVHGVDEAMDADLAIDDVGLGDYRRITIEREITGDPAAHPVRQGLAPAGFFGSELQNALEASRV